MSYPSTATLVAASSVAELTGLDSTQQDALRAAAIEAIEAWTRQAFTVETAATKLIDGSDGDTLNLPARLESATAVIVDGTVIVTGDYAISEAGDTLTLISPVGGSWLTRVRRRPGDAGPTFPFGRSNVSVTGNWGWTSPPQAVVDAIRFDMEDQALAEASKLAPTVRAARALGVSGINQGGLSVGLQGEPGLSARVKRKLTRYRWRASGVVV